MVVSKLRSTRKTCPVRAIKEIPGPLSSLLCGAELPARAPMGLRNYFHYKWSLKSYSGGQCAHLRENLLLERGQQYYK